MSAGLIFGSGMAFFAARYGLACDSIVEFEVVLADGQVVRMRRDGEHADLFRALKSLARYACGLQIVYGFESLFQPTSLLS